MANENYEAVLAQADELADRTIDFRRRLHRRPEIGLQLPITQEAIRTEIGDLGLDVRTGSSTTSVVAVLDGASDGPTVLLRGDMDALPLTEHTGLDFASEIDGVMHACGHDTHVAMLAGAARLLADRRADIAGRVVFMFQPGEEGFHGARYMLEEGLLEATGQRPTGAFALHISSSFVSGTINTRPGALLASSDTIRITVQGRGGHASAPHYANDPIPVACEIVIALQTMVTRRIDIFDPAVVTIAHLSAGTTNNVIPATAVLEGTIRTLSAETRTSVHDLVRQVARGIASAHGMQVEVEIEGGYPVTVNDGDFASSVHAVAGQLLGADRACIMESPIMGAEDWSYVLQEVPGAMAFLGACPPDLEPETAPGNHSNLVVFDETALSTGVATYAAVALETLAR
ncbi:MAG: amidohydrolase [Geodermatophilaceae bacterium]|nr:amidohydrolase [Geodermatophilaceae bacterium]MDQ3466499.1 M20 family metallopeptidase [Actinomycetota bacterium]